MAPSPISRKAREIFEDALEFDSPDTRAVFVTGACAGDAALLHRVQALLKANDAAESLLPNEPQPPAFSSAAGEQPGDRIGRYKLLEKIGEGGCGIVYMAEQEEPVRRRVALKVIKPGMDTRSVIARFEAERQALAMMDHPNIAKVHDGGVTEGGRPYFVMELVRGIRITDYCTQHNLSTRERLDLVTAVCSAVQHAHQKGIIHRDLKPSNILVTELDGRPVPKVIDFGIAKATEQNLTDKTLFTHFAQLIGTPAYMSPEQATLSGSDIDTRSDIYSLGVLLYELLTGTTPFDAKELLASGLEAMCRTIRETDPPKPSTRLTQSRLRSQSPSSDPSTLRRPPFALPADLDWIVLKCIEKDRARRYETASGLAQDIHRHLSSEPVTARPASAAYRFRKMIRRNTLAFAAAGAVLAALVAGVVVSTAQAVRATKAEHAQSRLRHAAEAAEMAQRGERTKAETAAARSDQIAGFLEDMLKSVGPSVALGRDTTLLREILDQTAERVGNELNDQPKVEAALRETLGRVYFDLGDFKTSETMHRTALGHLRTLHGEDDPIVAVSLSNLANALCAEFKLDEAEPLFREALVIQKRLLGGEHAEVAITLNNLALVLYDQSKLPEAESMFREALTLHRKVRGNEHKDTTATLNNLALVLEDLGKPAEAEVVHREILATKRKLYSGDHPGVATTLRNLAGALNTLGKREEAEAAYREALAIMRRVYPDAHPHTSAVLSSLGLILTSQGRNDEAETLLREAVHMARKLHNELHPELPMVIGNLALILGNQEKFAEAETLYREALAMVRALKNRQGNVANCIAGLAVILEKQGKLADAEPLRREALEITRQLPSPVPSQVQRRSYDLEENLYRQGKFAAVESLLLAGHEAIQKNKALESKFKRDSLTRLVRLYETWSQPDKASEWRQQLAAFDKAVAASAGEPKAESSK